jgi:hypothetical protein
MRERRLVPRELGSRLRAGGIAKVLLALLVGVTVGAFVRGTAEDSPAVTGVPRPGPAPEADASEAEGQEPAAPAQPPGPGPRSSVNGVGMGFERSEAGAVAATVSYAGAAQSWLYLSDEDVAASAEAVIAPHARDRLVGQLVDDVRLLREEIRDASGTVWYVVSPLATKVDAYSSSRAVVRVWLVRVLSADGVAVPQSGWQTLTFELEWGGDWLVTAVSEADGPTPQLEAGDRPWAASLLDETLAGFVRVGLQ